MDTLFKLLEEGYLNVEKALQAKEEDSLVALLAEQTVLLGDAYNRAYGITPPTAPLEERGKELVAETVAELNRINKRGD